MLAKKGDYVIMVGGRAGVVKHNSRWCKFECSICAREEGLLKRRIGTNDNSTAKAHLGSSSPNHFVCQANPKHR